MKYLTSITGYLWALLTLPIILTIFVMNGFLAEKFITITGLKISPWLTGGEVIRTIEHDRYQTLLHQPVFKGLVTERRKGFVQVDWRAVEGVLPEIINDEIDYDRDGTLDFQIQLNTVRNKAEIKALSSYVTGIGGFYNLENERAVRVLLKNKR